MLTPDVLCEIEFAEEIALSNRPLAMCSIIPVRFLVVFTVAESQELGLVCTSFSISEAHLLQRQGR